MISTISHDLQASDDQITQKWIGRLSMINKKPVKKLSRVLYGYLLSSHCQKALCNYLFIYYFSHKSKENR
jgi:hypothetical protein